MKQINDLIVVEVPKDAVMHRILGSTVQWDSNEHMAATYSDLPPGQYEIIGLYSEVIWHEPEVIQIAVSADMKMSETIDGMLENNNIPLPTDTTDLLFIHKIK